MCSGGPIDSPQSSFFDILDQLDFQDSLLVLGRVVAGSALVSALALWYSEWGRTAKPIRRTSGLLLLKFHPRYDLSDAAMVAQWKRNLYYPVF